jgi:hypothetical protein
MKILVKFIPLSIIVCIIIKELDVTIQKGLGSRSIYLIFPNDRKVKIHKRNYWGKEIFRLNSLCNDSINYLAYEMLRTTTKSRNHTFNSVFDGESMQIIIKRINKPIKDTFFFDNFNPSYPGLELDSVNHYAYRIYFLVNKL